MKTGVNTSTIIDITKKRKAYLNKGNAYCIKCKYLMFGYYCDKKKKSAVYISQRKHCRFYKKK